MKHEYVEIKIAINELKNEKRKKVGIIQSKLNGFL